MRLQTVSTHVSLRNLRRLTWVETVCYVSFFYTSQDHDSVYCSTTWILGYVGSELTVEINSY